MLNKFQQSIAKTRAKIREANRLTAVMFRQVKERKEKGNAGLELLLDDIAAETGLAITTENMPTIMIYVQQFLEDQARKKQEPDGDVEGMHDFPI
jgi:hypothetical protein